MKVGVVMRKMITLIFYRFSVSADHILVGVRHGRNQLHNVMVPNFILLNPNNAFLTLTFAVYFFLAILALITNQKVLMGLRSRLFSDQSIVLIPDFFR